MSRNSPSPQDEGASSAMRADLETLLLQQPECRMALTTLERRMRARGWSGWGSLQGWSEVCWDLGLYVYEGRKFNRLVTWVGLEQPTEVEDDEFVRQGFVLITNEGWFYRRTHAYSRADQPMFTPYRSCAHVWVSSAWAARKIREAGLERCAEVASTYHLR